MTEKFGTLGDMIDYAKDAYTKVAEREEPKQIEAKAENKPIENQKSSKEVKSFAAKLLREAISRIDKKPKQSRSRKEEELVLTPTKADSPKSRKSILKFIKEVHA